MRRQQAAALPGGMRCVAANGGTVVSLPELFHAVGLWYQDFTQTTDAEVRSLLHQAAERFYPSNSR